MDCTARWDSYECTLPAGHEDEHQAELPNGGEWYWTGEDW